MNEIFGFPLTTRNVKDGEGFSRIDGFLTVDGARVCVSPEALDMDTVLLEAEDYLRKHGKIV